jgi:hypothetical protein
MNRYLHRHHALSSHPGGDGKLSALNLRFTYSATAPLKQSFTTPTDFTAEFRNAVLSDPLFEDVQGTKEVLDVMDTPGSPWF